MQIYVLDMGQTKYGDCILIRNRGRCILIDGGHLGDFNSIRGQLKTIFGHNPPFTIDLLVVTHCHSDHIGCLPKLVAQNVIDVQRALVADENLGFGRDVDGIGHIDDAGLTPAQKKIVLAFHEEDMSGMSDEELETFFSDETLEDQYSDMLAALPNPIRYQGYDDPQLRALETDFADFGLEILGPVQPHLLRCWDTISRANDAIVDAVQEAVPADADDASLVDTFKRLAGSGSDDSPFAADQPGVGAAKNNQSIVLKVAAEGWTALLAGDMQFAKAEIPGLNPMMRELRDKVVAAGPYDFVKLTHHTSYNALDPGVLGEWLLPNAKLLVAHTGGVNDSRHPEPHALEALEAKKTRLKFARTDRNGLIKVAKSNGQLRMTVSKGSLNDFSENSFDEAALETPGEVAAPAPAPPAKAAAVKVEAATADGRPVEIIARVPCDTKVTITVEVESKKKRVAAVEAPETKTPAGPALEPKPQDPPPGPAETPKPPTPISPDMFRVGQGRKFEQLLFVTNTAVLGDHIGVREAAAALAAIRAASATVLEIPASAKTAQQVAALVRPKLQDGKIKGVVLIGGFDVVPAQRLDVLDAATRATLAAKNQIDQDADGFIVWSDDLYGDRDGDFIAELPVSRIPDGRSSKLVQAALDSKPAGGTRFGVRNLFRPFAEPIFKLLKPPAEAIYICEEFGPDKVEAGSVRGNVHLMLHGSAVNATEFWGETQDNEMLVGFAVKSVDKSAAGSVVCSGCCWGALSASPIAARAKDDTLLRPRLAESSIPLAFLRYGASAFVGCTGSHYSPLKDPYEYFGGPMQKAFWSFYLAGNPPAVSLFLAKQKFAQDFPHGQTDPFSRAVEFKILRQFTCLGLGW